MSDYTGQFRWIDNLIGEVLDLGALGGTQRTPQAASGRTVDERSDEAGGQVGSEDGGCVPKVDLFDLDGCPLGKIPTTPFSVYLAGPITGSPLDAEWRRTVSKIFVHSGVHPINPFYIHQEVYETEAEVPTEVAREDLDAIDDAHALLAYFPYVPDRQSCGTFCEIQHAADAGKYVVVVGPRSITDHPFIRNAATYTYTYAYHVPSREKRVAHQIQNGRLELVCGLAIGKIISIKELFCG